jgi:hypothetical protein
MDVHPDLLNGVMRAYRDHVIRVLGWQIPNVTSGEELVELARKAEASALEAEHELRTEPPFPGAAEKPDEMPKGWRMICAARLFHGGVEVGVMFTTFVSGRTPSIFINAPGSPIPEEYSPIL